MSKVPSGRRYGHIYPFWLQKLHEIGMFGRQINASLYIEKVIQNPFCLCFVFVIHKGGNKQDGAGLGWRGGGVLAKS